MATMRKTKVIHFTLLAIQESMKITLMMNSNKGKLLFRIFGSWGKKVILRNFRAMYSPMLIKNKRKVKWISQDMIMSLVRILLRKNHQKLKNKIQS